MKKIILILSLLFFLLDCKYSREHLKEIKKENQILSKTPIKINFTYFIDSVAYFSITYTEDYSIGFGIQKYLNTACFQIINNRINLDDPIICSDKISYYHKPLKHNIFLHKSEFYSYDFHENIIQSKDDLYLKELSYLLICDNSNFCNNTKILIDTNSSCASLNNSTNIFCKNNNLTLDSKEIYVNFAKFPMTKLNSKNFLIVNNEYENSYLPKFTFIDRPENTKPISSYIILKNIQHSKTIYDFTPTGYLYAVIFLDILTLPYQIITSDQN